MSEEESKKLFRKRKFGEIKMMMKSSTIQRTAKKVNYKSIQIYTSLKWKRGCLNLGQMMLIFLLKKNRKSTLTDLQLVNDVRVIFLQMKLLMNLLNYNNWINMDYLSNGKLIHLRINGMGEAWPLRRSCFV